MRFDTEDTKQVLALFDKEDIQYINFNYLTNKYLNNDILNNNNKNSKTNSKAKIKKLGGRNDKSRK